MEDNYSKLYKAMVNSGYDAADLGGSEDDFRREMQDSATRKNFYDWVAGNEKNGFRIGSYESYEERLAPKGGDNGYTFTASELDIPEDNTYQLGDASKMVDEMRSKAVDAGRLPVEGDIYKGESGYARTDIPLKTQEYSTLGEARGAANADNRKEALDAYRSAYNRLEQPGEVDEEALITWGNDMSKAPAEQMAVFREVMGRDAQNRVELDAAMRGIEGTTAELEGLVGSSAGELAKYLNMPEARREALGEDEKQRYEALLGAAKELDEKRAVEEMKTTIGAQLEEQKHKTDEYFKKHTEEVDRKTGGVYSMRGGGIASMPQYISSMAGTVGDKQWRTMNAIESLNSQSRGLIESSKDAKENTGLLGNVQNYFKEAVYGLADIENWLPVLTGMNFATVKGVIDKADEGKELTKDEEQLLEAIALNVATKQMYADDRTWVQDAGSMTGQMVPFMLEMAAGGMTAAGKGAMKGLAKWALKKFGKGASKSAKKAIYRTGAVTGLVSGAVGGGYASALTVGAPRTTAEVIRRTTGEGLYNVNEDGKVEYAGHKEGEGVGEAIIKGTTKQMLEYGSEIAGAGYASLPFQWLQKTGKGTRLLGWMDNFANSDRGKLVQQFMERTGWHGPIEEFMEEIHVGLLDPDTPLDEFFTKKNLMSIALGVAVPGAVVSSFQTVGGIADGSFKAGAQEKWKMQRGALRAGEAWKERADEWHVLRNRLNNGNLDELDDVLTAVYEDPTLTDEQKLRALEYGVYSLQYRTAIGAREAMDEGRMSNIDAMLRDIYGEAFASDVSATAAKRSITALEEARANVQQMLGMPGANIEDVMGDRSIEEVSEGDKEIEMALTKYFAAKADFEGRQDRFADVIDSSRREAAKSIDRTKNDDGNVYSAALPTGETVYITGGKVVLDNEGYIDVNQSEGLVALMPDGSKKPVKPGDLREKIEVSNAEELKNARYAEIEDWWRTEFDAAENEEIPTTEVPSSEMTTEQKAEETISGDVASPVETTTAEVVEAAPKVAEVSDFFRMDGKNYVVDSRNEDGSVNVVVDGKRAILPAETDFSAAVPTDKRGEVLFTEMPAEKTLEYFVQRVPNGRARAQMIENNRKQAESALKKFDKEPNVGTDPDAYEATMNKWEADKTAAQAKVDYWNEVAKRDAEISQSEMRESVETVKPREVVEMTPEEFVANQLSGIKITPESFQKETGTKAEQKQMVGVIAGKEKGGVSIERAAEIIYENYDDELRGLGFNGDMQDVRDIIIDVLSYGNPRSFAKKGLEMRQQADVEQQLAELRDVANALNFESIEEQIAYEESIVPRIIQNYTGFDETEYFNNLAENYENDTTRESESTRGSSELLQGEQPADNAGVAGLGEPGQGGKVQGDVYSGGENATPQGNQQVSSSEIPNSSTVSQASEQVSDQVAEADAPGQSGVAEIKEPSPVSDLVQAVKKKQQARFADHAKGVAEKLGVKVTVHNDESTVTNKDAMTAISEGGEVKGWYNPTTGEIALFLPAMESMRDVESTILHEAVSHYGIKHLLGQEDFDKFLNGVWDMMPTSKRAEFLQYVGADMKNPSKAKMRQAADEYVAHIAEKMDLNELEKSVWQRFIDYVMDVLRKAGFKNLRHKDVEAVIRASYANLRENGGTPWRYANAESVEGDNRGVNSSNNLLIDDFGENLSEEGIRFSIRTDKEIVANREKQLARSIRNGLLSKSEANDIREASKAMLEIAQVIADAKNGDGTAMFPSFSQWNGMEVMMNANGRPVVSVIKANSEYPMNIDFAKDCIKRDATNRVLNRLAQVAPQMFTSLTSEQLAAINDIIKKHGLSVPCVGCFVEAKRYRSPEYARSVVNVWNTLVDAVEKGDEAIAETKKELGDKVSLNKIVEHLKKNPSDRIKLSESDIVSPKNYSALMIEHPAVPQLLQNTQGQNVAQLVVPEAVYYGDILKLTGENAWDIDAAYQVGGVRIQSFSDFKSKLFFDYCQVLADLASKRLPAHSYTKVPAFAELFGLTGMKINLSLYFEGTGLDSEGNYTYSSESISPEFAYDLQSREGYTENVGTMAIGVSDEHIWKMMKDENIRSISPYHKSGINPVVANRLKASQFTDYTNEQNAVTPKTERLENESWQDYYGRITERVDDKVPSVGKKVVPDFNLYDDLLETNDPVQTAKNYVEHCQANGIVPKFASFVYNPDGSFNNEYYKLLYDFAVTDMNGEYAPQRAVTWNGASMPANTAEILQSSLSTEEATIAKNQAQTDAVVDDILRELGEKKEDIRFRRANKNQEVFVSNAQRAVEGIKQEKATPEQWIAMLKKNGGLKAGEEAWLGLEEWLNEKQGIVTKQEILGFIGENKIQIEEVEYSQEVIDKDEIERSEEFENLVISLTEYEEENGNEYPYINREEYDRLRNEDPDFLDGFSIDYWGEGIEVNDPEAAARYLGLAKGQQINDTRLDYTTDGLNNKREIALVVPTIEPYNQHDEIHFGDAGNGRAVAWVRFGETTAPVKEYADFYAFQKQMQEKYYPERRVQALNDADLIKLSVEEIREFERLRKAKEQIPFNQSKERVLVIDEIQSKRHQDGREKGYKDAKFAELDSKLNNNARSTVEDLDEAGRISKERYDYIINKIGDEAVALDNELTELQQKAKELGTGIRNEDAEKQQIAKLEVELEGVRNVRDYDRITAEIEGIKDRMAKRRTDFDSVSLRMREVNTRLNELINNYVREQRGGVEAAPFEKNWHELAMKRMLRLAAEEGFDKVAWTTGEQQAERYNLGSVVEYINVSPYRAPGSRTAEWTDVGINAGVSSMDLRVDVDGNIVSGGNRTTNMAGEKLANVVGKELADKILSTKEDTILDGESLRIGGEGMKGFYDRMLPSFVQKYTKKWGAKVGTVEMPSLEQNNVMHSVDVTPEMKESVMEGQTMFRRVVDRDGNPIGDGSWHMNYKVDEVALSYPNISYKVDESASTESVYVTYTNNDPKYPENERPKVTVRYSNHDSNAVKFGYQLRGEAVERNNGELLYRLGLKERAWIPAPSVPTQTVSKKDLENGTYEESELTERDIMLLPVGADIAEHKGKLIKGTNKLILVDKVLANNNRGYYRYSDIPEVEQQRAKQLVREIVDPFAKERREEETRFRFIGKKGAENLDKAEEATTRLDNLNVAREMEAAGEDAKAIKLATGWERGADRLWRYETEDYTVNQDAQVYDPYNNMMRPFSDFFTRDGARGYIDADYSVRLDELINDDELFKAYPELEGFFVLVEDLGMGTNGAINFKEKIIKLNRNVVRLIPASIDDKVGYTVKVGSALAHEIQHAIQDIEGFARGGNADMLLPGTDTRLGESGYRNLAGEVEARNVQMRMDKTEEERRNSLAEETYMNDVALEEQIFIFDNLGVSAMMGSRVDARMAEVASHFDGKELSPEQRSVVDVYGGKADNLTISVKTQDGNERKVVMRQGNETGAGAKHSLYRHYGTGVGVITSDDIISIPDVVANGVRTEKQRGNTRLAEYKLTDANGNEFTVLTEIKKGKEIFNDFYSNKKALLSGTFNTQSAHTANNNAFSADKGSNNSLNEQDPETRFRKAQETKREIEELDNETMETVKNLAVELNTPVAIVTDIDSIADERKRKAAIRGDKGWFDLKNGVVTIVMPNIADEQDAVETMMHEIVGHRGLRGLLGARYNKFLNEVYAYSPKDVRAQIVKRALEEMGKGTKNPMHVATEEYLAAVAERGFINEPTKWMQVVNIMKGFLRSMGVNVDINENEIAYMMWRSCQLLKSGYNLESNIMDSVMQQRMEAGAYRSRSTFLGPMRSQGRDLATKVELAHVRGTYERRVRESGFQAREALQDSMFALKEFQKLIEKATGKKLPDYFNAYYMENALSSANQAQAEAYGRLFYSRIVDAISELKNRVELDDIYDYLMIKHGIERNREMALKASLSNDEGALDKKMYNRYAEAKKKILEDADKNKTKWEEVQRELDSLAKSYGADLTVDYSGLSSIFKEKDFYEAAYKHVLTMDEQADFTELHKAIKNATDETLKKRNASGFMSKATMDEILDMYQYYVPLRGFEETTADEVYNYMTVNYSPIPSIKRARGRKSKAENPIAWIANAAEAAIVQGNRNMMKLAFYNGVAANPNDLVSIEGDIYIQKVNGQWVVQMPDIPANATAEEVEEIMTAYNERMKEMARTDKSVKRVTDSTDIPFTVVQNSELKEHQIFVRRNGKLRVMTVNGNPRLAQAINGMTNPNNSSVGMVKWFEESSQAINSGLSKLYTTANPDFILSNWIRDMIYSNSMVWVKESPAYAALFNKNCTLNAPGVFRLLVKYEDDKLNMKDPVERMFHEFMVNGGETGYTKLKDVEAQKKKLKKMLESNGVKDGAKAVEAFIGQINRAVENAARFAAYRTSREMGRSITRSIYDAKEISVNFNKKGAGARFAGANGQTALGNTAAVVSGVGRGGYVFWNAGVQGMNNFFTALFPPLDENMSIKDHAVRYSKSMALIAVPLALGYLAASMGADDDEYQNLSPYVRRSNLCFKLFGNTMVTIPLPIEYRAIYGTAEYLASVANGKEELSAWPLAEQLSQLLPIDMLEGGGGAKAFIPSLAKPVYEGWTNTDWMGSPIAKQNDFNKLDPEYRRVYENVSAPMVGFSRMLNELGGGNRNRRASIPNEASHDAKTRDLWEWAFEWNPAILDNTLSGYAGGYYSFPSKVFKTAEMMFGDLEFDWKHVPFLNRVLKTSSEKAEEYRINEKYFDNLDVFEKDYHEFQGLMKDVEDVKSTDEERDETVSKIDELISSGKAKDVEVLETYKSQVDELTRDYKKYGNDTLKVYALQYKRLFNEKYNELYKEKVNE